MRPTSNMAAVSLFNIRRLSFLKRFRSEMNDVETGIAPVWMSTCTAGLIGDLLS